MFRSDNSDLQDREHCSKPIIFEDDQPKEIIKSDAGHTAQVTTETRYIFYMKVIRYLKEFSYVAYSDISVARHLTKREKNEWNEFFICNVLFKIKENEFFLYKERSQRMKYRLLTTFRDFW